MKDLIPTRLARIKLAIIAHFEAFLLAPKAYVTATFWLVLRKRVRARAQYAKILSRTSGAYDYWMRKQANPVDPSPTGTPPIVAFVMADQDASGLEQTFASLEAEGIAAFRIEPVDPDAINRVLDSIDWSAQPWLLLLNGGDLVSPGAVQAYREEIQHVQQHVIFADDDLLDDAGRRKSPYFKPDWNPELFANCDYITGSCAVRVSRETLEDVGFAQGWAGALVARALADGGGAAHLRRMLHHRRARPETPIPPTPVKIAPELPSVTVIIPTRNRVDLLAKCIKGLESTQYPALEVIVVDNDSDDAATLEFLAALPGKGMQVIRYSGPFNYSAINNRAVAEARGEVLCLLNNDIEILAPDWLAIMASQVLRKEVGAVGAQLLYPDGRIQHAGVAIGIGNAAGHAHRFILPDEEGYFRRHALPQFVSAVTGACLVVRRDRFLAVGGLDEENFPVAFNDVDLCLRLNRQGWQSLYEPRATLVHHESVSRGFDKDPVGAARFAGELAALQRLWKTDEIIDPFHHPELSRECEQFALAL